MVPSALSFALVRYFYLLDRKLVRINPIMHSEPYINCFIVLPVEINAYMRIPCGRFKMAEGRAKGSPAVKKRRLSLSLRRKET